MALFSGVLSCYALIAGVLESRCISAYNHFALPVLSRRPARGPCDTPEVCDGSSFGCPDDKAAPEGTQCDW
jgi:hypothetical protein